MNHNRLNIILQGIGGSRAYGLEGPNSDTDRYAIYLASTTEVLGFSKHASSYHVTEPEDFHYHELEKFLTLALKGNPTIMELLWLDEYEIETPVGSRLVANREKLMGVKAVVGAYTGYAMQQMKRHGRSKPNETEAERNKRIKNLKHCYRLILQAQGWLSTGFLSVRLTDEDIHLINSFAELEDNDLAEAFSNADYITLKMAQASHMPSQPDRKWAQDFLIQTRLEKAPTMMLPVLSTQVTYTNSLPTKTTGTTYVTYSQPGPVAAPHEPPMISDIEEADTLQVLTKNNRGQKWIPLNEFLKLLAKTRYQ